MRRGGEGGAYQGQFIFIFIVLFLGQFCPRGKGAMRLTKCEAPTRVTKPDHNTGNYVPSLLQHQSSSVSGLLGNSMLKD